MGSVDIPASAREQMKRNAQSGTSETPPAEGDKGVLSDKKKKQPKPVDPFNLAFDQAINSKQKPVVTTTPTTTKQQPAANDFNSIFDQALKKKETSGSGLGTGLEPTSPLTLPAGQSNTRETDYKRFKEIENKGLNNNHILPTQEIKEYEALRAKLKEGSYIFENEETKRFNHLRNNKGSLSKKELEEYNKLLPNMPDNLLDEEDRPKPADKYNAVGKTYINVDGVTVTMQKDGVELAHGMASEDDKKTLHKETDEEWEAEKNKEPVDKAAVLNWINNKFPKPTLTPTQAEEKKKQKLAAIQEAVNRTPTITAVEKKPIPTKKDIEEQAANNIVEGRSGFNPNAEDPLGDMMKKKNADLNEKSIDDFFEGKWKEHSDDDVVKNKEIDFVKDLLYNNGDEAGVTLQEYANKKNGGDISKLSDGEVMKLAEGNETMKVAAEKYTNLRDLQTTIAGARNFDDAATTYMQNRYDKELGGQIKYLRKEGGGTNVLLNEPLKGQIMFDFLSDKNLQYLKDKDPKINEQYTKALYNFPNQYPDHAEKLLSEMIADEREKTGMNNFFANVVGKESTDKIVDDLIARGDLPPNYKAIYTERIRPSLGTGNAIGRGIGNMIPGLQQFVHDSKIPTPGFLENTEEGFENTMTGTAKSIANITQGRRLYSDEAGRINSALEKQLTTRAFEPEGLGHKASMVGGHLTGFVLGLSPGSTALKAAGLLKNVQAANAIAMGAAVYGDYQDRAKQMFPGQSIKQYLYTDIMTAINMVGAKYLPGTQINKMLQKQEGAIMEVIDKAAGSKISTDFAISKIKDRVMPIILEGLKKTGKGNLGAGEFMAANTFIDQSLSQILKGEHLDIANNSKEAMKQFGLGFLGATFISAAGAGLDAHAEFRGVRNQIYDIASHPQDYKDALDIAAQLDPSVLKSKPDILDNLNIISSVKKQLDSETSLSDKQKKSYVVKSLQEHALEKRIAELTEPELKKPLQEKLKVIKERKKKILEPIKEVNDNFKERIAAAETEEEKEAIMQEHADNISKQMQGEPLSEKETAAVEGLQNKNFDTEEGRKVKPWTDIIQDPNRTPEEKKQALKELSDQLTSDITGADVGVALGKEADLVFDLGHPKFEESDAAKKVGETPTTKTEPTVSEVGDGGKTEKKSGVSVIMPSENKSNVIPLKKAESETTQTTPEGTEQIPTEEGGGTKEPVDENVPAADEKPPSELVGKTVSFDGKEWTILEDNGDKVKVTNGEVVTSVPKETATKLLSAEPPQPPITDVPQGTTIHFEHPQTELSMRGLQVLANEFGFENVESRDKKSDLELMRDAEGTVNDWAQNGVYAKNIEELVRRSENNGTLNDEERVILEQHVANLAQKLRGLKNVRDPQYDEILAEVNRVKKAGEKARQAAGAALRIPIYRARPRNILDAFVEEMEATRQNKLTDEQKENVKKEWEDLEKAKEDFEKYKADREREMATKDATSAFEKARKSSPREKKSHDDFVAERSKHVDNIKDKLKKFKMGGGPLSAVPLPYIPQLIAIAPDVAKIMLSYAKEEGSSFLDFVDDVHSMLKNEIKGITHDDVIAMAAGRYNEKKPTDNELKEKIYDWRKEARLLDKLNQLNAGDMPMTEKKERRINRALAKLEKEYKNHPLLKATQDRLRDEKKISELKGRLKDLEDGTNPVKREKRVREVNEEIADLQKQIKEHPTTKAAENEAQVKKLQERLADLDAGVEPVKAEAKKKEVSAEVEDLRKQIKEHPLTKEVEQRRRDAKRIEDLEQQLSDLDDGVVPEKREKKKAEVNDKIKELQQQVKDHPTTKKAENEEQIKKLQDRLANLDAGIEPEKVERKKKEVSAEVADLRKQVKEHPLTKEIAKRESDEKRIADLQQKLDDLNDGIAPQKRAKKKAEVNQAIKDLQEEIKNHPLTQETEFKERNDELLKKLNQQLADLDAGKEPERKKREAKAVTEEVTNLRKQVREHETTRLANAKASLQRRIDKVQAELDARKAGTYEEPKKLPKPTLDKAGQDLQDKLMKLTNERELRLLIAAHKSMTGVQKTLHYAADILNIPRSLMTIGDYSAMMRQGIIPTIAHPGMAFGVHRGADGKLKWDGAFYRMFKAGVSQTAYDRWFHELRNEPRYDLMRDTRLAISDNISHELTAREEQMMSSLVEKFPIIGQTLNIEVGGKNVKIPGTNLVKGSERAYTMYLNKMRVDLFNMYADLMESNGKTYRNSPEQYKQMAQYVNNVTGRGSLGPLEKIGPLLNATLFSGKLISSRVNMLTYLAQPRFYKKVPSEIRKAYFADMAKFITAGVMTLGLMKLWGNDVEADPRSTDFGKIKNGNTRWDIWGGFQPYARVGAQVLSGERKKANGKLEDLGDDKPYQLSEWDILTNFLRSKTSPVLGAAIDLKTGKTMVGQKIVYHGNAGDKEISIGKYILEHMIPLTASGTAESMQDQGAKAIATVGIPNLLGIGTQTYKSTKPKKRRNSISNDKQ